MLPGPAMPAPEPPLMAPPPNPPPGPPVGAGLIGHSTLFTIYVSSVKVASMSEPEAQGVTDFEGVKLLQ